MRRLPRRPTRVLCAGAIALATLGTLPAAATAPPPVRLLVTLAPGAPVPRLAPLGFEVWLPLASAPRAASSPPQVVEPGAQHGRVLVVEGPGTASSAAAALAGVEAVEPDALLRPATLDPGWPQQWSLENTGQRVGEQVGTAGEDLSAVEAWRISVGAGSVVAVLDGPMELSHPDLDGAIWTNPDERRNGLDDDGNGWVDDVSGIDLVEDDADVTATDVEERHATELAGVIAARRDNRIGIAGAAPLGAPAWGT